MMLTGTPSRASSTACAWRSWCGANRRRTLARWASVRSSRRALVADQARRPPVGPSITDSNGPTGGPTLFEPVLEVFEAPVVHTGLAAFVAFAVLALCTNWLVLLFPKDLLRTAALPLALIPFVVGATSPTPFTNEEGQLEYGPATG